VKPRLLDLFCCQGGAAEGYASAGFDVVGIDINAQPHYPYEFHQADALTFPLDGFDAYHASPPCQARSDLQKQSKIAYEEFVPRIRERLRATGRPYVIENVEGATDDEEAQLIDPIMLCGTMFPGLRVIRHRLFEANFPIVAPAHPKHPLVFTHDKRKAHYGRLNQDESYVQVTGGGNCTIANKRAAMGVPWMTGHGANEAIPPAYTEYVGGFLMAEVERRNRAAA
jgi:DNA (cytosine-5)-methyltransferase 1